MIPPAYDADDFGAFQDHTGQATTDAIERAKVTHVVNLSSIGAQLPRGTGPIAGLYRQERRLDGVPGLNITHLRPAYFMENQLWSIPTIKQQGINGSPMRGDMPIHMIATQDIAHEAAEILGNLEFRDRTVVELAGPRQLSLQEATSILGQAIGKPDLAYVQFPYAEAEKAMLGMGMKPSIVSLMVEMQRAFNEGRVVPEKQPAKGKTTFEQFAKTFAKAYQNGAHALA
jgi:uncharacterized protein YbjT (DUF2867 family)